MSPPGAGLGLSTTVQGPWFSHASARVVSSPRARRSWGSPRSSRILVCCSLAPSRTAVLGTLGGAGWAEAAGTPRAVKAVKAVTAASRAARRERALIKAPIIYVNAVHEWNRVSVGLPGARDNGSDSSSRTEKAKPHHERRR